MAQGKFSNPRPHRDEERQIEEAFRQVTGQAPAPQAHAPLMTEEEQLAQTIREIQEETASSATQVLPQIHPQPAPTRERAPLDMEDVDAFFDRSVPSYEHREPATDYYEEEPDFLDKLAMVFGKTLAFCDRNRKAVLVGACSGALLLILLFIGIFFAGMRPAKEAEETILHNVYLADIPVGGMSKAEAITAVKQATAKTYPAKDMVIDLSGTELTLSPRKTKVSLDVSAAVEAALEYGHTGTKAEQEQAASRRDPYIIGLLPYLDLDTDYIMDVLTDHAEEAGSTLTQPSYGLEGKEPELSADKFNEKAPTQTLVITLGTPGIGFDVKDVYNDVLDAYSLHSFEVFVENVTTTSDPEEVDLEAIYEEFYIAPVNASVNLQTYETIPGSYGYEFDLKAAQKLLDEAEFGEQIRIPMQYIAPEVLDGDSFFRDTLGSYQTRSSGSTARKKNLELACEAINGTVLDPGETFSFNGTVGQRTGERGYRTAPADSSATGGSTLGGGISQVSSTLYYAALLSDLEIISRQPNQFAPGFIDYGMDANVSWGLYDFSFRNNLGYPIRIQAELSGGYVRISIMGTEERSNYVLMDYTITKTKDFKTEKKEFPFKNEEGYKDGDVVREGITGYTIKTYKVRYDMRTNEILSRDYVATTEYESVNRIVADVLPEETVPPTTVPPTTTAPPTTAPPTSAPTTAPTDPPASESPAPSTEPSVPADTQPPAESQEPAAEEPAAEALSADAA